MFPPDWPHNIPCPYPMCCGMAGSAVLKLQKYEFRCQRCMRQWNLDRQQVQDLYLAVPDSWRKN